MLKVSLTPARYRPTRFIHWHNDPLYWALYVGPVRVLWEKED